MKLGAGYDLRNANSLSGARRTGFIIDYIKLHYHFKGLILLKIMPQNTFQRVVSNKN